MIFRRTIVGMLVVAVMATVVYAPISFAPPRAYAAGPVYETNPVVVGGIFSTASATGATAVVLKVLDGLAWTLAKVAIQSMTQSIVTWINNGFNGSPAFITDLDSNLQSLSDEVVDEFMQSFEDNTGLDIHTPFQDQVKNAIRDSYYRTSSDRGRNPNYDLNQASDDPAAFLAGDFNKGGFDAWFSIVTNADDNPLGAFLKGKNELASSLEDVRVNRLHELDWGKGFLSWRGSCAKTNDGSDVSLATKDTCADYHIETPGSIVEGQLEEQLGTGVRQLELADSINEIVSALMGQLVNSVLGSGGLSGVSHHSASGGASIIDRAADPSQYGPQLASLSDGFATSINKELKNVQLYQQNWQKIGDAATTAKSDLSGRNLCTGYADREGTITNVIDPILARADTASSTSATAITKLQDIQTRATAVKTLPAAQQTTAINAISQEHDGFLASGGVPGDDDIQDSSEQANDSGNDSPVSLYTQMLRIHTSCSSL